MTSFRRSVGSSVRACRAYRSSIAGLEKRAQFWEDPVMYAASSWSGSSTKAPIGVTIASKFPWSRRSEEHTSELQSRLHLVCRLLLEKKKKETRQTNIIAYTR